MIVQQGTTKQALEPNHEIWPSASFDSTVLASVDSLLFNNAGWTQPMYSIVGKGFLIHLMDGKLKSDLSMKVAIMRPLAQKQDSICIGDNLTRSLGPAPLLLVV